MTPTLAEIPVSHIKPNPNQPRKEFDREGLEQLAESLKTAGQVVPIQVRPVNGGYELIAGERRVRAAKMAGLKTLWATVEETSKETSRLDALIENLARADLNEEDKEAAIVKEWETGINPKTGQKWQKTIGKGKATSRNPNSMSHMSRALGMADNYVAQMLKAHEVLKAVPETSGIPTSFRAEFAALFAKGDLASIRTIAKAFHGGTITHRKPDFLTAVQVVPRLTPEVQKALASGQINLEQAKDISVVRKPEEQEFLQKEVQTHSERAKRVREAVVAHRKEQSEGVRSPDRRVVYEDARAIEKFQDVAWKVKTLTPGLVDDLGPAAKKAAVELLIEIRAHTGRVLTKVGALPAGEKAKELPG